jgi:hypothetical protein
MPAESVLAASTAPRQCGFSGRALTQLVGSGSAEPAAEDRDVGDVRAGNAARIHGEVDEIGTGARPDDTPFSNPNPGTWHY